MLCFQVHEHVTFLPTFHGTLRATVFFRFGPLLLGATSDICDFISAFFICCFIGADPCPIRWSGCAAQFQSGVGGYVQICDKFHVVGLDIDFV